MIRSLELTIPVKLPTYEYPIALSVRNAKEDEQVAKTARRGDYSEGEATAWAAMAAWLIMVLRPH